MKTPTKKPESPHNRMHFQGLCVTGGQQPYGALQQTFRDEQISSINMLDTQFLDAPCFTGAGSTMFLDFHDRPAIVNAIAILDGRL